MGNRLRQVLLCALLGLLCGCATPPEQAHLHATQHQAGPEPASLNLLSAPAPLKTSDVTHVKLSERYGELPLSFEANQGQSAGEVRFLSRGPGYSLFLTADEAVLSLSQPPGPGKESDQGAVVRMTLLGAHPKPTVTGLDLLPGKSHYFMSSDPKDWHTGIPHYAQVRYQSVYPGIDLLYYGNPGQLEYDFVVAPGADPKSIRLSFAGMEALSIDAQGHLILHTATGEIKQHKPVIYQASEGERKLIAGRYVLAGQQVGFQVAAYDTKQPLIIDPVLVYATYLGGSSRDSGNAIAVDGSGQAYVTGSTTSSDFPVSLGALDSSCDSDGACNAGDTFVTQLNATGSILLYSTYLGGSGGDGGHDIAMDSNGNIYVVGSTNSIDFPALLPFQGLISGGGSDAFVSKFGLGL